MTCANDYWPCFLQQMRAADDYHILFPLSATLEASDIVKRKAFLTLNYACEQTVPDKSREPPRLLFGAISAIPVELCLLMRCCVCSGWFGLVQAPEMHYFSFFFFHGQTVYLRNVVTLHL